MIIGVWVEALEWLFPSEVGLKISAVLWRHRSITVSGRKRQKERCINHYSRAENYKQGDDKVNRKMAQTNLMRLYHTIFLVHVFTLPCNYKPQNTK